MQFKKVGIARKVRIDLWDRIIKLNGMENIIGVVGWVLGLQLWVM